MCIRDSGNTVLVSNPALSSLPVRNTVPRPGQHNVKIHPINANARIVFDAEVNVLLDAKPKVALVREVLLPQLVLLDLQPLLEDLLGLGTTYCTVDCNLLITTDAK